MFRFTAAKKLLDELDRLEVPPVYLLKGEIYQEAVNMVKHGRSVESVALTFKGVVDKALESVVDDNGVVLIDNSYPVWLEHQRQMTIKTAIAERKEMTKQPWIYPPSHRKK